MHGKFSSHKYVMGGPAGEAPFRNGTVGRLKVVSAAAYLETSTERRRLGRQSLVKSIFGCDCPDDILK